MKNLNWFQARTLAYQGKAVRRDAWRQWLMHSIALYFIDRIDATTGNSLHYVVNNFEFGAAEFLANDWTDEPWPDGGTPPSNPIIGGGTSTGGNTSTGDTSTGSTSTGNTSTDGTSNGGSSGGSSTGGSSSSTVTTFLTAGAGNWGGSSNPPDPISVWQFSGGGSSGGVKDPAPFHPPNNPPTNQPPTITVTIIPPNFDTADFDDGQNCFMGGQDSPRHADMTVGVQIAGGPPGVGTLRIQLGEQTKSGMTGWAGMNNNGIDFKDVPYNPGSQITATAFYTINSVTYTGTGNYTFPDWCSGYPVGDV